MHNQEPPENTRHCHRNYSPPSQVGLVNTLAAVPRNIRQQASWCSFGQKPKRQLVIVAQSGTTRKYTPLAQKILATKPSWPCQTLAAVPRNTRQQAGSSPFDQKRKRQLVTVAQSGTTRKYQPLAQQISPPSQVGLVNTLATVPENTRQQVILPCQNNCHCP